MTEAADDLQTVYRERVLEHSRNPHNFGKPAHADCEAHGHNPLCGDKVSVYVELTDDTLDSVSFEGTGCAISMAAASMMTDALRGLTRGEAQSVVESVDAMFADAAAVEPRLDELKALEGVRAYPSRIKCATLPWKTLAAALNEQTDEVSTEKG